MFLFNINKCLKKNFYFWNYEKKELNVYLSSEIFLAEKYFQDIRPALKHLDKRFRSIEKNSKGEIVLTYIIKLKKGDSYKKEAKKIVRKLMNFIQGRGKIIHWDDESD